MMQKWFLIIWCNFIVYTGFSQKAFVEKNYYDEAKLQVKEIITVGKKDSIPNGIYQSFFQNGSLESKGYYHHGITDSLWVFYYQNGQKKANGFYKNGAPQGTWKYYFESGQLKSSGQLAGNVREGSWNFYYENGRVKSTGTYKNGIKLGIWNYFYEDESLKAQSFYEQNKATYKEFYPSGKIKAEGTIHDEKSTGAWVYYFEDGSKEAAGNFVNGLRTGEWLYFHENGEKSAKGNFQNGAKQGLWTYYHEDGSLSAEGDMKVGLKDGFWKLFYPSGELKGEANYDVGTGLFKEYYPSGQLRAIGDMRNGKKHGLWKYYNETGIQDGQAEFDEGDGNYIGYYPDGIQKMNGRIKDDKRVGEWTLFNSDGTLAGTYTPVYEEVNPIFRTGEIVNTAKSTQPRDKPEYKFKNTKLRYFDEGINEYKGIIMGINPLWSLFGQLPLAVEYYKQERMGYEINFTIHRKPFYKSASNLDFFDIGTSGLSVTLRQKFYHEDTNVGMFYFGHELQVGILDHKLTAEDSADVLIEPVITEYEAGQRRFAYGLLVGNRWMQRTNDSGFTLDFHLGIGVGSRDFDLSYEPTPLNEKLFNRINQDRFYVPVIIGINIGFAGPKRRSTSF